MKSSVKRQVVAAVMVVTVAVLGSVFVNLGMKWFAGLSKPSQWIPNFVIPLVWTVIYLLAIVTLVVSISQNKIGKTEAWLFALNGILNVLWCLLFFTFKLTFLGLIAIVFNFFAAIILYLKIRKNNLWSKLMLIYPSWVSLATFLNAALWILN